MRYLTKSVAVLALASAVNGIASASFGQTITAAQQITSGSTYDGWTITFPTDISLVVDPATTSSQLQLEKVASFSAADAASGLTITFTQSSASAAGAVDISDEAVTNMSGANWGGFQYLLVNQNAGAKFVQGSTSPFAPPSGYTSLSFSTTSIIYAGNQPNEVTTDWGMDTAGDLLITTPTGAIGTNYQLREIPLTSSPPTVIPLPAAGWQGLVGLIGLGVIGLGQNMKRKLL